MEHVMARPPSDRVDEAFEIWATTAERNDTRTAQQLGVAQETVSYWHRKYGWDERWLEVTAAEAERASRLGRQMMRLATPLIAQTLLNIIGGQRPLLKRDGSQQLDTDGKVIMVRGGTDKDVINAAKLLLSYNLGDPRTAHYEPDPDPVIDVAYASAASFPPPGSEDEPQSLPELKASVQALIESTIQSVNTRPSRSRKRV
jgi:hypothetical protein